jgi:hypothetical protein
MAEGMLVDGRKDIDVVRYGRILIWYPIHPLGYVVRLMLGNPVTHSPVRIYRHMQSTYA